MAVSTTNGPTGDDLRASLINFFPIAWLKRRLPGQTPSIQDREILRDQKQIQSGYNLARSSNNRRVAIPLPEREARAFASHEAKIKNMGNAGATREYTRLAVDSRHLRWSRNRDPHYEGRSLGGFIESFDSSSESTSHQRPYHAPTPRSTARRKSRWPMSLRS